MGMPGCGSCRSAWTGSCSSRRPCAGSIPPMPHTDPARAAATARDLPTLDALDRGLLRLPAAGRVARGAGTGQGRPASATRRTGAGRCPGSGRPTRGSCSSGSRRRRTAATAPAACSRATPRATSCGARCTPSASRTGRSSRRADDGLTLTGVRIAAAVRCAPPANKPTPAEQATCRPYLVREIALLRELRVIVALGAIGWDAALRTLAALGAHDARPQAAASPTAPRRRSARTRCSAPTTRASRTRSPAA